MSFSNPIVGGVVLIRPAIQSPDFEAGVQGWSINRDGTAEFTGITIVSAATNGQVKVENGQVELYNTSGALVGVYNPEYTKWINDANEGMIWVQQNGGIGTGGWPEIDFFTANSPGAYNFAAWFAAVPDANGNPQIGINGTQWTSGSMGVRDRIFMQSGSMQLAIINTATQAELNSFHIGVSNSTSLLPIIGSDTWHDMTMENGCTMLLGAYSRCQYRLMLDGTVRLRGVIHCPAGIGSGTWIAATSGAPYAPPASKYISVAADATPTLVGNARIIIDTNGNIELYGYGPTAPAVDITFDGVQYESATYLS